LITVPLAVLKAPRGEVGAIEFSPPLPSSKLDAMQRIEMGEVIRVTLRFRERFWDHLPISKHGHRTLHDMAFLFSEDEWFPTWWTTEPAKLPIITGWAPWRAAQRLSRHGRAFILRRCTQSLAVLLNIDREKLDALVEDAYYYNWRSDPYSRGAYSYGKVGSDGRFEALAAPVADTLYFAGEATDTSGNTGTVHGAIATGYRAAREICERHKQST
jgi:monoamine oxidase